MGVGNGAHVEALHGGIRTGQPFTKADSVLRRRLAGTRMLRRLSGRSSPTHSTASQLPAGSVAACALLRPPRQTLHLRSS